MAQATFWKTESGGTFNAGFWGPAFIKMTEYQAMHAAKALNMAKLAREHANKLPSYTMRHDPRVIDLQTLQQKVRDCCRIAGITEAEVYANINKQHKDK